MERSMRCDSPSLSYCPTSSQLETTMHTLTCLILVSVLMGFIPVVRCCGSADGVNLALHKPAFQSSTHLHSSGIMAVAGRAVDGNPKSFSHTRHDANPWWMVDLQGDYLIESVELTSSAGMDLRNTRIQIGREYSKVSDLCAQVKYQSGGSTASYPCTETARGRYIKVATTTVGGFILMEVKVYGLSPESKTGSCQKRYSRSKTHSVPTFPSILTVNVTGVVQCAGFCQKTYRCHAFSVEKVEDAVTRCNLYDSVGSTFAPKENVNFYTPDNF